MEMYSRQKRKGYQLIFVEVFNGGWGVRVKPKQDYSDWIFQTYRGTNLDYDMLCEPTSSDNEEKEGDGLSNNCLINLKH